MTNKEVQDQLSSIFTTIDRALSDRTIPRNVKRVLEQGRVGLLDQSEDIEVSIATMVYSLEELASDINIPSHARTMIWEIISAFETIKEKLNK